ncbi:MAG TPA: TlpA disulfide reductase family protein [Sporichthyaceae bacterium]
MRTVIGAVAVAAVLAGCGSGGSSAVTTAQGSALPIATVDDRSDGPSIACTGLDKALATSLGRQSVGKHGKALPKLTLPCLGGGPAVALAGLRGPAVLNVWASWCGPCGDEVGFLVAAEKLLHSQVRFIGVDLADEPADARTWNAYHQVGWPSLVDPHGALRGPLHVPGPPVTFFISSDGTIAGVHYGAFTSADEVRRAVATKLGVGTPASAKGLG